MRRRGLFRRWVGVGGDGVDIDVESKRWKAEFGDGELGVFV
jgi:hypothetical protein